MNAGAEVAFRALPRNPIRSVEPEAAGCVLNHASKNIELEDIELRVAELERRLKESDGRLSGSNNSARAARAARAPARVAFPVGWGLHARQLPQHRLTRADALVPTRAERLRRHVWHGTFRLTQFASRRWSRGRSGSHGSHGSWQTGDARGGRSPITCRDGFR